MLIHVEGGKGAKDLDHKVLRSCSQFHPHSLVGDPGIAVKERQGFADVFRGGHGIEDGPRITRIGLLGEVKTKSSVLGRLCGAVEEPALSSGRYAMMEWIALRQVALRHAHVAQHRGGRDVTLLGVALLQGVNRLLGRIPHRRRQALPTAASVTSAVPAVQDLPGFRRGKAHNNIVDSLVMTR
jgi:hypothetical protein